MGKAGRWLRNLLLPGWKGRKARDRADDCQSVLSAPPLPSHSHSQAVLTPTVREKRRWSFRRPGAAAAVSGSGGGGAQDAPPLASSSSHCFSEADVRVVVAQDQEQDQQQQQQVPEAAPSSCTADTVVVEVPAFGRRSGAGAGGRAAEAAVRIQAAFRSYLARKALRALRGMVKLQAMVRGQLVRRQADLTLRRMQALVHAQRRARAERLRLLELNDGGAASTKQAAAAATPRRPPPSRRRSSPQHPRSRKATPTEAAAERCSEEHDVRIVEVDDGAPRAPKTNARRSSSSCGHHYSTTTTPSRTPAKAAELLQQKLSLSPTPSAVTDDASARTFSDRFDVDDATSFASASEPMLVPMPAVPSRRSAWRAGPPPPSSLFLLPSYMANTESSRARAKANSKAKAKAARSQSAPRQRLSSASSDTAASPSPSCCERPSSRGGGGGSARRRASLDPMDLLAGGGAPMSRRVERCASRAHAAGSECGSSSTSGHRGSARTAGHGGGGYGNGMGDY